MISFFAAACQNRLPSVGGQPPPANRTARFAFHQLRRFLGGKQGYQSAQEWISNRHPVDIQQTTNEQPMVNQWETSRHRDGCFLGVIRLTQVRLGKVRLGKVKLG